MKRKTKFEKKIISLFMAIIIITSVFAIAYSISPDSVDIIPNASAQATGCCIRTVDNKACQENIHEFNSTGRVCVDGEFHTGQPCSAYPEQCDLVTCIPPKKECQSNVAIAQCVPYGQIFRGSMESYDNCTVGCCNILGKEASVLQKKVCYENARDNGYSDSDVTFTAGITSDSQCILASQTTKGCCLIDAGTCKWTTNKDCSPPNFYPNTLCQNVQMCGISNATHNKGCGTLAGETDKIYWFSEKGTQEALVQGGDCEYPAAKCVESANNAQCISTTCNFTLNEDDDSRRYYGSGKGDDMKINAGQQYYLRTTESRCYNLLYDKSFTFNGWKIEWNPPSKNLDRTTGLQAYQIHCLDGNAFSVGLGTERKIICNMERDELGKWHTENKSIDTDVQRCMSCGSGGVGIAGVNVGDIGDYLQFIPIGGYAGGVLSNNCGGFYLGGTGFPPVGDKCSNRPDCIYDIGFLYPPIGSCVPKVPLGKSYSKCSECGGGGDSAVSYCTPNTCEMLGDCQFEKVDTKPLEESARNLAFGTVLTLLLIDFGCKFAILGATTCAQLGYKSAAEMGVKGTWNWFWNPLFHFTSIAGAPAAFSAIETAIGIGIVAPLVLPFLSSQKMGICYDEKPLEGSSNCDDCNKNDPLIPCTPERCAILGNCINKTKTELGISGEGYKCLPKDCQDNVPPVINKITAKWYVGDTEVRTAPSTTINDYQAIDLSSPVNWNVSSIYIQLDMNKESICKWTTEQGKSYDEITDENKFKPYFSKNVNATISVPGVGNEVKMYFKCKNLCEAKQAADYNYIKFTIGTKPDDIAPKITYRDPVIHVSEELGKVNVRLWLDENGNCRYLNFTNSSDLPFDYNSMKLMDCVQNQVCQGLTDSTANNKCAHCNFTINFNDGSGIEKEWEESSTYYQNGIKKSTVFLENIVCRDSRNNEMSENYSLITMPGYELLAVTPGGGTCSRTSDCKHEDYFCSEGYCTTYNSNPFIKINSSRMTECRYSIGTDKPYGEKTPFAQTGLDQIHSGTIGKLNPSSSVQTVYIECQDWVPILNKVQINIRVLGDTDAPKVIRAYTIGSTLKVVTNENAVCKYNTTKCNFDFSSEGSGMSGNLKDHTIDFAAGKTYYVRCNDTAGLTSTCTEINPSVLGAKKISGFIGGTSYASKAGSQYG